MGLGIFKASTCGCEPTVIERVVEKIDKVVEKIEGVVRSNPVEKIKEAALPNPDPNNFEILKSWFAGEFVAVEIRYPDCTNYEGRKILVYKGAIEDLQKAKFLDPHFCEGEHISPIARFEPTGLGWDMAMMLVEELNEKDWAWLFKD
jgi:hypothetical protein